MPINNNNVLLGPWGGEDGTLWDYTAKGAITRISITSDSDAIRSISFASRDEYGNSDTSLVFGTPTGPAKEININPAVEKLILIEGVVDTKDFIERVTQLSFTIRKNGVATKYGPYGSQGKGIYFSCPVSEDQFVGFYGNCSDQLLNSIGVMVRNKDIVQSSWGGEGGAPWSYKAKGTISHIYVSYGDVIQAIRFTSIDASGSLEHSDTFGDSNPSLKFSEIKIDLAVEKLNGITGTYGKYGDLMVIRSLVFTTNKKKRFGVFGKRIGIPFEYNVKDDDEVISGFYGRSGSLIDAIGVCKKPSNSYVAVGPIGSSGGDKWSHQPKGLITRIILYIRTDGVYAIATESKDEQGSAERSSFYGYSNPPQKELIEIDIKGKLNSIGGTVAVAREGGLYLTSLNFSTDEKIMYGPYGYPTYGTRFSLPVNYGFISGFHGTNGDNYSGGKYIQSLGVYVNPI